MVAELLQKFVSQGFLSASNASLLKGYSEKWNQSLIHSILDCHVMSESDLADSIAEVLGIERLYDFSGNLVSSDKLKYFTFQDSMRLEAIPIDSNDLDEIVIAAADPSRIDLCEYLEKSIGGKYVFSVCERSQMISAILEAYPVYSCIPSLGTTTKA